MAIKNTQKKPFIEDNDDNIFIGLDLPIRKSEGNEGFFASTSTTIEAVKNNIRNLIQTNPGERLMQPRLGLNLRRFLFNQLTIDDINSMQNEILDTLKVWLPFVEIRDIIIKSSDNDININPNTLSVNIKFNIKQDPNTLDSVQVDISNTGETSDTTFTGGGGY
tara:strand:+ start:482 stop:973 length:492 start_codon:yes stop_codon:yes gene_type:complete